MVELDLVVVLLTWLAMAWMADEKGGLFSGLKEKLASKYSKNDGKPTFAGAPPGSANPPEGWSFATNCGPTGGSYGPTPGSYNPEEPYRPSGYVGGGYRAGSAAYSGAGGDPRESANSQLREKAYGTLSVSLLSCAPDAERG